MENPFDRIGSNSHHESVQAKESNPQDPNKQAEDSNPQELNEQVQESSKPQDPNELAKGNDAPDPKEQVEESMKPQELNEQHNKPQDRKDRAEEQMEVLEPQPLDEQLALPSIADAQDSTMKERQGELLSSPAPELTLKDSTLHEQDKGSTPQDLKEQTEESIETSMATPLQHHRKQHFVSTTADSQKKTIKMQKDEACSTLLSRNYPHCSSAKPMITRNLPMHAKAALQGCLFPKVKPRTADKAIQCNKMLMQRLPLLVRTPPQRIFTPKVKPPADHKATQISPSFERLLKRPPLLVKKKKKEDKTIAQISPKKSNPSSLHRGSGSYCGGTAMRKSLILKKGRKPKAIYNLYVTIYDGWKEIDPVRINGTTWEDCVVCSGLSRSCTVFSNLKAGRIHISKLLPVLRTLGILVTSDEMYQALKFVSVDASGTLNFSEFLEVVNKTSPFAETDALQNTLQAFRKIKKGMVTAGELKPVLTDLGVSLSSENVEQTLGQTRVNKNGKFDLLEFLLAARKLQRSLAEEAFLNEYTTLGRRPFQDVSGLVNAESRWRKKYQGYLDEEIATPTSLCPLLAWAGSNEDTALAQPQKSVSWKSDQRCPSTAFPVDKEEGEDKGHDFVQLEKSYSDITNIPPPVHNAEGEGKDHDIIQVKRSQSDPRSPSTAPLGHNAEEEDKNHDVVDVTKSSSQNSIQVN